MSTRPKEFTGRHMLLIMFAFFGVIITVNLTMAKFAGASWAGLVVKNSYVAGQSFNERLQRGRDQIALNWTAKFDVAAGRIGYSLTAPDGSLVKPKSVTLHFRHPSDEASDWTLDLTSVGDGRFEAKSVARDGTWLVQIDSDVGRKEPYRDARRVIIREGTGQ